MNNELATRIAAVARLITQHGHCRGPAISTRESAVPVKDFALQLQSEGLLTSNGIAFRGYKVTLPLKNIDRVSLERGSSAGSRSDEEIGMTVKLRFKEATFIDAFVFRYGFDDLHGPKPWSQKVFEEWSLNFQDYRAAEGVIDLLNEALILASSSPSAAAETSEARTPLARWRTSPSGSSHITTEAPTQPSHAEVRVVEEPD